MKPSTKINTTADGSPLGVSGFRSEVYNTLYQAYSPFLVRILACLFLGLWGRGLLLGNANVIGYWVDSFCTGPQCKEAPSWFASFVTSDYLTLLAIMTGIGFVSTLVFRVIFSRLSARAVSTIYDEVTYRTSRFPMSFFDKTPTGRVTTRFSNDYGQVFRLFGGPLAEFASIIFDLLMMIILITLASPIYLVFVVLIATLNYLVYLFNRKRLRANRRELSASRSPSISHFSETTQGASTIRTFNRQSTFIERFERLDQYYLTQKLKTTGMVLGFSFQMNSLTALLFLTTGLSAYYLVQQGWVSVGSVGVAFTFIAMSGNTVQMFFEWLTQFEEAMVGLERLDDYLRKPLENGAILPAATQFSTGHAKLDRPQPNLAFDKNAEIEVRDLWFRYREDLPWVLKGLHFKISKGERVGIIGRTGSGKSSLIQALFFLYPAEKGQITINGLGPDLSNQDLLHNLNNFRSQMSLITQDPVLFQGSLRLNLDLHNKFSDERILEVLERVGLRTWTLSHPLGLEQKIEERGKNLSLGERQLLCMARSLLQETPIVVMDEATSSVDPQSEEIMVKATEEFFKDRTQIIIAHRLSTLKKCHRVLWLDKGEIRAFDQADVVLAEFARQADDKKV
ncbi:MAG: ABC transporter ATP-binding protein [Bdellovibrionia bacterium]